MTGKEKIQAAFSASGTSEIPVAMCYDMIFRRDHWQQFTSWPWWYVHDPDIGHQRAWIRDYKSKLDVDWFCLSSFFSREERAFLRMEVRKDKVCRINSRTGKEEVFQEPLPGGPADPGFLHPGQVPKNRQEIDEFVPLPPQFDARAYQASGRGDLAEAVKSEFGRDWFFIDHVVSPLMRCPRLWGFEETMMMMVNEPALVQYATERYLANAIHRIHQAAALGVDGMWIEETMTDMISPDLYRKLNAPPLARLVEEIRKAGLKSIYYYCGNPTGKLEDLLAVGADALSLEEGKKGFAVDIEEIARHVRGHSVLFGNLDAVGVLQDGTEEDLTAEIKRQVSVGRKMNNGRFIMNTGSPITPGTPIERVRLYCDLVHQ